MVCGKQEEKGTDYLCEVQPLAPRPSPRPSRSPGCRPTPRVHLGAGGPDQQTNKIPWGSGLFQRVNRVPGPVNSTTETYRMKRGPPRKGGVPSAERTVGQQLLGCFRSKRCWGGGASLWTWAAGRGLALPFQRCSGQTSAHPEECGWWAWQTEYQEGWGRGIRGMEKGVTPPTPSSVSPAARPWGPPSSPQPPGQLQQQAWDWDSAQLNVRRRRFPHPHPSPCCCPPRPKGPQEESPLGQWGWRKVL